MERTTILLSTVLKTKVVLMARKKGISMGKFIRDSLKSSLANENKENPHDPFFSDQAIFEGKVPADIAKNHDDYLYN